MLLVFWRKVASLYYILKLFVSQIFGINLVRGDGSLYRLCDSLLFWVVSVSDLRHWFGQVKVFA